MDDDVNNIYMDDDVFVYTSKGNTKKKNNEIIRSANKT